MPSASIHDSTDQPARLSLDEALASARDTRSLVIGRGALEGIAPIFQRHFPGRVAIIVADPTTYGLAGERAVQLLRAGGLIVREPFVFPDPWLQAEHAFVEQLDAALQLCDAIPVAVGAGTINDLTKLAAHRADRPYLCVATAASMDGYTAFGASITQGGAKQTFQCPAPVAVIADLDLIRRAPPEMTASGYADLMAKITAGADWIAADALGIEAIEPRAWAIVQGGLRPALRDPAGARAGNESAIAGLVEGLMLGGFAMQWTRTSRPASGAEHQFSHLWDMEHHVHGENPPSHGFKVGVATVAIAAFCEALRREPLERIDPEKLAADWPSPREVEARVRASFAADGFTEVAVVETLAKHVSAAELRAQLERLKRSWPRLRERLGAQLLPVEDMKRRLREVGAPTEPEEIGISRERLRRTFRRAMCIRRRFTVLDLAARAGCLESCVDHLFDHRA